MSNFQCWKLGLLNSTRRFPHWCAKSFMRGFSLNPFGQIWKYTFNEISLYFLYYIINLYIFFIYKYIKQCWYNRKLKKDFSLLFLYLQYRNFDLIKLILKNILLIDWKGGLLNIKRVHIEMFGNLRLKVRPEVIDGESKYSIFMFLLIIPSLSCSTNMDMCMRLVKNTASSIAPNAAACGRTSWYQTIALTLLYPRQR